MVRTYSDFGLFEITHGYKIQFGSFEPESGKSISSVAYNPPRYELKIDSEQTIMKDISVTHTKTEAIAVLPGILRLKVGEPQVVTVRVPFSLCGVTRGAMGDG